MSTSLPPRYLSSASWEVSRPHRILGVPGGLAGARAPERVEEMGSYAVQRGHFPADVLGGQISAQCVELVSGGFL